MSPPGAPALPAIEHWKEGPVSVTNQGALSRKLGKALTGPKMRILRLPAAYKPVILALHMSRISGLESGRFGKNRGHGPPWLLPRQNTKL